MKKPSLKIIPQLSDINTGERWSSKAYKKDGLVSYGSRIPSYEYWD